MQSLQLQPSKACAGARQARKEEEDDGGGDEPATGPSKKRKREPESDALTPAPAAPAAPLAPAAPVAPPPATPGSGLKAQAERIKTELDLAPELTPVALEPVHEGFDVGRRAFEPRLDLGVFVQLKGE